VRGGICYGTLCVVLRVLSPSRGCARLAWMAVVPGHKSNQAMSYFEALESATGQQGDEAVARIKAASTTLRDDFPSSGYTSRGLLVAAMALQQRGGLAGARQQLEWLVQRSADQALVALGKLRLAGILLQQKQYEPALALLGEPPPAFAGLYEDRRRANPARAGQQ